LNYTSHQKTQQTADGQPKSQQKQTAVLKNRSEGRRIFKTLGFKLNLLKKKTWHKTKNCFCMEKKKKRHLSEKEKLD